MANPIQQGLKHETRKLDGLVTRAAMANPIQQGLKLRYAPFFGSPIIRRNG